MDIQHAQTAVGGAFYMEEAELRIAELSYVRVGTHQFVIDHTEVSEKLKGHGAGKQLVLAAVQFARDNGLKIFPVCPFARSVFDKTPELHDVKA